MVDHLTLDSRFGVFSVHLSYAFNLYISLCSHFVNKMLVEKMSVTKIRTIKYKGGCNDTDIAK